MKGLVIRQPWIGMILNGEKTWEMRSQPCRHRGPVALIEKGSGTVVGLAKIVNDLPPLSELEMHEHSTKHRIPKGQIEDAVRAGWIRPWVISDVAKLQQAVPYRHTSGGSWVNLTREEEAAVLSRAHSQTAVTRVRRSRRPPQKHDAPKLALSHMSGDERSRNMHSLPHIGGKSYRSITDADMVMSTPNADEAAILMNPVPRSEPLDSTGLPKRLRRAADAMAAAVKLVMGR